MRDEVAAFPVAYITGNIENGFTNHVTLGMTLRDYFAGQALAGLLATTVDWSEKYDKETANKVVSKMSYDLAEAMLVEREREKEKKDDRN